MTERPEQAVTAAGEKRGSSAGQRLRAQREKSGLTLHEAAMELHLDYWMLEALEADDFEALGAPVFAKGHLRKYAVLLGLPPDDLMAEYYRAQGKPEAPPLMPAGLTRPGPGGARLALALVGVALVLAGIVAVVWWVASSRAPALDPMARGEANAPVSLEPEEASAPPQAVTLSLPDSERAPSPEDALPRVTEEGGTLPALAAEAVTGAETPPAQEMLAPSPEPALAETPADALLPPMLELSLRFERESWVEVYDAERQKLLFGLGQANSRRTVRGEGPLQVFLGFGRGVEVQINGRPYEIPAEAWRGNTARFSVSAAAVAP